MRIHMDDNYESYPHNFHKSLQIFCTTHVNRGGSISVFNKFRNNKPSQRIVFASTPNPYCDNKNININNKAIMNAVDFRVTNSWYN